MRIVLITGRLAKSLVEEIVKENPIEGVEVVVHEAPIDVAALINVKLLDEILPTIKSIYGDVDYIIIPGYVAGDLEFLNLKHGVRVVKGVKNARDIPLMIKALRDGLNPSTIKPFDDVLVNYVKSRDEEVIRRTKVRASIEHYFEISGKPVSPHYPLIFAECLVKKTELSKVLDEARRLVKEGADVIVLGVVEDPGLSFLKELLIKVKGEIGVPVGVDTVDKESVMELIDYIDVVLNVHPDELESFRGRGNVTYVVTPRRVDFIDELIQTVENSTKMGLNKIILDPVLNPPMVGLVESIHRYWLLRRMVKDKPLLMGVSNVTEMIDADSPGIVALLASIGVEIGIEVYLAVEASVKTRNMVKELRKAIDLAVLARETKGYPKDFSVNLLVAKSKRDDEYCSRAPRELRVKASLKKVFEPDPAGLFRISVDRLSETIVVEHYIYGSNEPDIVIEGQDPYAIATEVFRRRLVSSLEHAFYLGYELAKAYRALVTGGSYVQD